MSKSLYSELEQNAHYRFRNISSTHMKQNYLLNHAGYSETHFIIQFT